MKGPRGKPVNASDQKEKLQAKKKICYKSQRVVAFSRFFKSRILFWGKKKKVHPYSSSIYEEKEITSLKFNLKLNSK